MGRNLISLGIVLSFCPQAFAACLNLDFSAWTQAEKNQRLAAAYSLAATAGHDDIPTVTNSQICFSTFDPNGVINPVDIKTAVDNEIAIAASQATQRATLRQQTQDELTNPATNDICAATDFLAVSAKIQAVHDMLNTQIQAMASLADAKTTLTALNNAYAIGLAKIARCTWADKQ